MWLLEKKMGILGSIFTKKRKNQRLVFKENANQR